MIKPREWLDLGTWREINNIVRVQGITWLTKAKKELEKAGCKRTKHLKLLDIVSLAFYHIEYTI